MPTFNFVKEVLQPYLRTAGREKAARTQETERWIEKKLQFFSGYFLSEEGRSANELTGSVVTAYREARKAEGVSPVSIKRELAVASAAVNWAIAEDDREFRNPFEKRMISRRDQKAIVQRKRRLSQAEVSQLILAAEGVVRDVIIFAAATGLRQGEILNLRWSQLAGDEIAFLPSQQKSRTEGARALSEEALAVLAAQPEVGEFVFTDRGTPLNKRAFHRLWDKVRQRAGVVDVQFHDLRRYLASEMLEAGGRMEDVKTQLGHADVRTTQRAYAVDSLWKAKQVLQAVPSPLDLSTRWSEGQG